MCEPRCRTQENPSALSSATTSRGLRTRTLAMSIDSDHLSSDEFAFQGRLAVLEQHRDHLAKVALQFFHGRALRVRAGKPGNVADEQASVGVALDDRGVN